MNKEAKLHPISLLIPFFFLVFGGHVMEILGFIVTYCLMNNRIQQLDYLFIYRSERNLTLKHKKWFILWLACTNEGACQNLPSSLNLVLECKQMNTLIMLATHKEYALLFKPIFFIHFWLGHLNLHYPSTMHDNIYNHTNEPFLYTCAQIKFWRLEVSKIYFVFKSSFKIMMTRLFF